MKQLSFLLFIILPISVIAQNTQSVIPKQSSKYCLMVPLTKGVFNKKVVIKVDFGQGFEIIKDENGEDKLFISEAAALNYLAKMGWEIVLVNKRPVIGYTVDMLCYVLQQKE